MTWHRDKDRYKTSGKRQLLCHFTMVKEIRMSTTLTGGISPLCVSDKINVRILNERLMQLTEKKVGDEQGGFRRRKSCVDQILAFKMLVEEYLGKDRKLHAAFMDLEKVYDRDGREAL